MGASAGLDRLLGSTLGPTGDKPATTGVRGVAELASASLYATTLTHCSSAGTAGAFGAPAGVLSKGRVSVSYRSQLGRLRSGRASRRAKASFRVEVLSFVGVLGFALTRLQNLTSGVWLEKATSVAAEVADGA
jgi:hypothetical protein